MSKIAKRDKYVDYLKLFAIILVMIGHTNSPFSLLIYSFHMPLFFFVSGYYLAKNESMNQPTTDFKKFVIPYFGLSILSIGIIQIKNIVLGRSFVTFSQMYLGIIYGMSLNYLETYGFVLWFLLAIFFSRTIASFLVKNLKWYYSLPLLIVLGKLSLLYQLPLCINQGIIGSFWVLMGHYYFNTLKHRLYDFMIIPLLITIVICVLLSGVPIVDISALRISDYFYYLIYCTFILVIFDIAFSHLENIDNRKLLLYSKKTMIIFVFHPYTNNIGYILSKGNWFFTFLISILILYLIDISIDFTKKEILKLNV